jgi:hypothetical protein
MAKRVGDHRNDAEALLLVAHAFQVATDLHKARPPL